MQDQFSPLASGLLDTVSSTRGAVLYRGASGWVALSPGTSGHFLKSNGSGADPSYAAAGGGSFDPAAATNITFAAGQGSITANTDGEFKAAADPGAGNPGWWLHLSAGHGGAGDTDGGVVQITVGEKSGSGAQGWFEVKDNSANVFFKVDHSGVLTLAQSAVNKSPTIKNGTNQVSTAFCSDETNSGHALSGASANTVATMTVANNSGAGCEIEYTIIVQDGTDYQAATGRFSVSAVNKAGTLTVQSTHFGNPTTAVSGGTLSVTPSTSTGTGVVNIRFAVTSSLGEPDNGTIYFKIHNNSNQATAYVPN